MPWDLIGGMLTFTFIREILFFQKIGFLSLAHLKLQNLELQGLAGISQNIKNYIKSL
jgi:hypothetical protein